MTQISESCDSGLPLLSPDTADPKIVPQCGVECGAGKPENKYFIMNQIIRSDFLQTPSPPDASLAKFAAQLRRITPPRS